MAGPRTSKTGAPQHVFRTCRCPYVILCHLMSLSDLLISFTTLYNSLHFPIFPDSSGDFEGAVETNIWDALQPSIVIMTSRRGSVSQLVAACGELSEIEIRKSWITCFCTE